MFDTNARAAERAFQEVPRRARALVALERATPGIVERGLLEFQPGRSLLHAVRDADWVIEAVTEDLIAKQKVTEAIDEVLAPEALRQRVAESLKKAASRYAKSGSEPDSLPPP